MKRLLFFVGILLGCSSPNKISYTTTNNGNYNKVRTEEIKEVTLDLARENCIADIFSFCSDGHEQPYRLYPLFVKLQKKILLSSYDTVFMFPSDYVIKQIRGEGKEVMDTWKMDIMFSDSLNNTVTYDNDEFCQKVNNYYRRNKISKDANCEFSYQLYKMKVKVMYGGEKQIVLPDFDEKNNSLIKDHISHVYYITSIESVKPIE